MTFYLPDHEGKHRLGVPICISLWIYFKLKQSKSFRMLLTGYFTAHMKKIHAVFYCLEKNDQFYAFKAFCYCVYCAKIL